MMLTGACSEGDGSQRTLLKRTAHSLPTVPPAAQAQGTTLPPPQAGAVTPPVRASGITCSASWGNRSTCSAAQGNRPAASDARGDRFAVAGDRPTAFHRDCQDTDSPIHSGELKNGDLYTGPPQRAGRKNREVPVRHSDCHPVWSRRGRCWRRHPTTALLYCPDGPAQTHPSVFFDSDLDEKGRPGTPVLIPEFGTGPLDLGYVIALSPDGTRLAYAFGIPGGATVSVVDLSTGHRRDWSTRQPDMVSSPAWAPNGHDLALASSRGGPAEPPTSAGRVRSCSALPGRSGRWRVSGPLDRVAYAPDGKTLVYAVRSAIERISVTGEDPPQVLAQLDRPGTASLTVAFSLDGTGAPPALRRGVAVVPAP